MEDLFLILRAASVSFSIVAGPTNIPTIDGFHSNCYFASIVVIFLKIVGLICMRWYSNYGFDLDLPDD